MKKPDSYFTDNKIDKVRPIFLSEGQEVNLPYSKSSNKVKQSYSTVMGNEETKKTLNLRDFSFFYTQNWSGGRRRSLRKDLGFKKEISRYLNYDTKSFEYILIKGDKNLNDYKSETWYGLDGIYDSNEDLIVLKIGLVNGSEGLTLLPKRDNLTYEDTIKAIKVWMERNPQ